MLCGVDHPEAVRRLVMSLADTIDEAAEARFVELLQRGGTVHARRLAASALSSRSSPTSLDVLVGAARGDGGRAVRMDALKALSLRRGRASAESAATIQSVFERLAQGEADPELRAMAIRLSGGQVPGDVAPPPSPRKPRSPLVPAPKQKN